MAVTQGGIVAAAFMVLEEYGFADLTMRQIAKKLGVQAGTLYYHVPNKQNLLYLMAEQILAEVSGETPYQWCVKLRQALLDVRDGGELVAAVFAMRELDLLSQPVALLHGQGVTQRRAEDIAVNLVLLTLAHVVDQQSYQVFLGFGVAKAGQESEAEAAFKARFDFGLHAMLDGI